MVRVSKTQRKEMEEMKLLTIEKGRYPCMSVSNKGHKSKNKTFYVRDDVYRSYINRKKSRM